MPLLLPTSGVKAKNVETKALWTFKMTTKLVDI